MKNIIQSVDELNSTFKNLLPLKTEFQSKLDKKFRLEFNYNSNHLEGNTLTYGETELLLIFDETTNNHTFREYEEMKAHDVALTLIKDWATNKERPITETDIKTLNRTILVKPFWKDAITSDGQATRRQIKIGDYKEFPNSVRLVNGEMFEYSSVIDTPIEMGQLMDWYRTEEHKMELHPVTLASLLHYKFVRIHPFDDGNGRIARLLTNYVLLKHDLPLIVIKSADKRNYLAALHQADIGNLDAFVSYITKQVIWSLEISIKAAKGESIDEPDDLEKEISLLERKIEISKVNISKNNSSLIYIWDSCLFCLLEKYLLKFSVFDKLFNSVEKNIYGRKNDDNYSYDLGNGKYFTEVDVLKHWFDSNKNEIENIVEFEIFLFFRELKDFKFTFNVRIALVFNLNTYKILIFNQMIEKKYNQLLEKTEIEELVNKASEQFLNQIKAEIDKLS